MSRSVPLVVHVIHRLDFGGLENGLVNLVNRMPSGRYRHAIVCVSGINPEFRKRILREDVEVVSLEKRPGKDLRAYVRLWRMLRRLHPCIVHTRNFSTVDMQWVAALAGVRHRIHGEHGWEASDPVGRDPRKLRIRRACRPVVQLYVPMSRDIARWLVEVLRVAPSSTVQLYNGVDVERFRPASIPSAESTTQLNVGTIGRLDPVKNHAALLHAFASLRSRLPGLRLTIVGDGPLKAVLHEEAARLGIADYVQFTGARNDTPDLMRTFDVFVLPSINEGVSNTILEAMATGLPVVAARVGGNPELVCDGATGRLYDPAEPAGLECALLPYLRDRSLRVSHGRAGRDRVAQNFSLDSMVAGYLALYDGVLRERRGRQHAVAN